MKLKIVEVNGQKYAEVQDDKPVYIDDDNKEIAFDAPGTRATIQRLNGEAKAHREAKESAEGKLKAFEGIADPAAALKAIETVKNIDDKKLIDAGRVDEVKREVSKSFEDKINSMQTSHATALQEKEKALNEVTSQFHSTLVKTAFSGSKYVTEKFVVPPAMLQDTFGKNFKIEEGKMFAVDNAGNKLYSRARPAELADFDEALGLLVDAYPYRDDIMKGRGGGSGSERGVQAGGKTISRAAFDNLSPADRSSKMREGVQVVD